MSPPEIERELAALDAALEGRALEAEHAELALLVADVRSTAPEPDAAFVRRLEDRLRVQAAPRPRRRVPWPALRIVAAACTPIFVVAAIVFALHAGGPGDGGSASSQGTARSGGGLSGDSAGSAAASAPGAGLAAPRRRVERSTQLALEAPRGHFADVTDAVVRTADRFGGIVQSSTIDDEGGSGHATFDLRFGIRRVDAALAALSRVAHVRSRSAASQDVTGAYAAAARRVGDARATRRGLLRALAAATTANEVASLRARLRDAGAALARAEARLAAIRRSTDRSGVTVTVDTARASHGSGGGGASWTPGDALRSAAHVLVFAAGIAVVVAAVLAPFALLAALWLAAVRLARRRGRRAALGAW